MKNYKTALENRDPEETLKYLERMKNIDKDLVDETCEIDPDWTPGVATYAVILSTILALFTIVNFIHGWRRDGRVENVRCIQIEQADGVAFRVQQ